MQHRFFGVQERRKAKRVSNGSEHDDGVQCGFAPGIEIDGGALLFGIEFKAVCARHT